MPENAAIVTNFIGVSITGQSAVLSWCKTSRTSLTKATPIIAIAPSPTIHLSLKRGPYIALTLGGIISRIWSEARIGWLLALKSRTRLELNPRRERSRLTLEILTWGPIVALP